MPSSEALRQDEIRLVVDVGSTANLAAADISHDIVNNIVSVRPRHFAVANLLNVPSDKKYEGCCECLTRTPVPFRVAAAMHAFFL